MYEEILAEIKKRNEEKMKAEKPKYDKRVYTVNEIQDILGIGRTSAYNLVNQNLFHVVRVGGSIRISKKSFDEWLDNQL